MIEGRGSIEQHSDRAGAVAERYYAASLATVAALGLACGLLLPQVSHPGHAPATWTLATGVILVALVIQIIRSARNRGHLPPLRGALLQEAIDVGVVLNALRALR